MKITTAALLLVASLAVPATASADELPATGIGECNKLAQLYLTNPDTPVPPDCVNRGAFKRLLPPGDTPPPPGEDAPPPADAPAQP